MLAQGPLWRDKAAADGRPADEGLYRRHTQATTAAAVCAADKEASMALRDIRIWPDPCLSTATDAVKSITQDTQALVADLFDTMRAAAGLGLAANQVGVNQSVLVVDLDADDEAAEDPEFARELKAWGYTGPMALINPKIVRRAGTQVMQEGCLSVPGVTEAVTRAARIEVAYHDLQGRRRTVRAQHLFAVCIQHEMDHLMGRVFVEYLPAPRRAAIERRFAKRAS